MVSRFQKMLGEASGGSKTLFSMSREMVKPCLPLLTQRREKERRREGGCWQTLDTMGD